MPAVRESTCACLAAAEGTRSGGGGADGPKGPARVPRASRDGRALAPSGCTALHCTAAWAIGQFGHLRRVEVRSSAHVAREASRARGAISPRDEGAALGGVRVRVRVGPRMHGRRTK